MLDAPNISPEGRAGIIEHFKSAPSYTNFYLSAFQELGTERQNSMGGAGRIPRSKIKEYAMDYGFSGSDLFDFIWIIQQVDNHLIGVIVPKQSKGKTGTS